MNWIRAKNIKHEHFFNFWTILEMCEHFLNFMNSCCVIVGWPKFLSVRVAGHPGGIVVFPVCQTSLGFKIDRDYKFRVPISGIQSLGFDLAFIYNFKFILDFFHQKSVYLVTSKVLVTEWGNFIEGGW